MLLGILQENVGQSDSRTTARYLRAQMLGGREAQIEANRAAHAAVGHWDVPTFAFVGEPFYGQDRLDALLWWLKSRGLRERRV